MIDKQSDKEYSRYNKCKEKDMIGKGTWKSELGTVEA